MLGGRTPLHLWFRAAPLYLSCMICAGCSHCSLGWFPPSFSPWLRIGVLRFPVRVPPCLPHAHVCCMNCGLWGYPSSPSPCLRTGLVHGLARVAPLLPYLRTVCSRCWVGGLPTVSLPRLRSRVARSRFGGSPSVPWLHAVGVCCRMRVAPPPPSGWPHALSAHNRSGGSARPRRPPACRALGARAAQSCPPLVSPSAPLPLSL